MLKKEQFPPNYVLSRNKTLNTRPCSRTRTFNTNCRKVCQSQERRWLKSRGKEQRKNFSAEERSRFKPFFEFLDVDKSGWVTFEELYIPLLSLGLATSKEEVEKLFVSAKFNPADQLSYEDMMTLMREAKNDEGEPVLYNFINMHWSNSTTNRELPLLLYLSNRRRQLMIQAFTGESSEDRKQGARVLSAFAQELRALQGGLKI